MGPKQMSFLKDVAGGMGKVSEAKANEEDDDDAPELFGTNFEEASKK